MADVSRTRGTSAHIFYYMHNNTTKATSAAKALAWTVGAYLVLAGLLRLTLPAWSGFGAQWRTFYWDSHHCLEQLHNDGGFAQLLQDFWLQFLERPTSAALAWALPCLIIFWLLNSLLRWLIGRWSQKMLAYTKPLSLLLVAMGAWIVLCNGFSAPSTSQRFKAQMCMVANEDWDGIIAQSNGRSIDNNLELNLRNLALAETGQLTTRFKEQAHNNINNLVVLDISSPYISAMLSDIYWSMGEISMSQMYAFETNEKLGNLSPRLLKRLVQTNIAFGHYEVASKYLCWLEKTLYHRDWAKRYREFLSDKAVLQDCKMRLKRGCIPSQNCFPSLQSVVHDLQIISEENPEYKPSSQYLEAINMIYGAQ